VPTPAPLPERYQPRSQRLTHTLAAHPDQGWSLLRNGVIVFDDFGELLPDGRGGRPVGHGRPDHPRAARPRTGLT
jgi:hypothetical protein